MAKMTRKQRRRRMCEGKVGHDSKEAALAAIYGTRKSNEQQDNIRAVAMKAYQCRCGKWHIGHGRRLDWRYLEQFL